MSLSLQSLRYQFDQESNRAMSLPMAGAIVWAIIGVLGWVLEPYTALFAMLFLSGAIFPLGLLFAYFRNEKLLNTQNPLAKLIGSCVLMVNLLWALHIPLIIYAPEFLPLSLGIGLGLHWVVYSWVVQHPVGVMHAVIRTLVLLVLWVALPEWRMIALPFAITAVYMLSLVQMQRRPLTENSKT